MRYPINLYFCSRAADVGADHCARRVPRVSLRLVSVKRIGAFDIRAIGCIVKPDFL